ncbi:flavin reductase family protein [Streptomyces sp. NPDC004435]|uniref:flavin reductase family protein n=1 Tax=Streptomyces sp. NPDC004435 TaxID=3364701 RepID=UPI0036B4AAD6
MTTTTAPSGTTPAGPTASGDPQDGTKGGTTDGGAGGTTGDTTAGGAAPVRPDPSPAPDAADFRAAMGRFPTGVTLLTQGYGDRTSVITLNSLVSVSLDPLLLLVSVKSAGRIRPRVGAAGSFAVNVLGRGQRDLAVEFCRPDRSEGQAAVRRMAAVPGVTGNAVMPSAEAYVECVLEHEHRAGDHTLLIGRAVAVVIRDRSPDPLLFHRGGFTGLPTTEQRSAA